MKKFIPLFICICIFLASCGKKDKIEPRDTVYPSDLVTVEELAPFIGYTPVMSETRSRRVSDAVFVSDPIGKEDIVEIKVRQKNGLQSESEVKEYFDECKKMRSDAFDVQLDNTVEAFIAYPTLHYYINGYHVEITAGSGSDDLQKNLLQNIANITLEKLMLLTDMKIPADSDNTEQSNKEDSAELTDTSTGDE
ncbi:MAG: hypothetical protein SOZ34_04590 [Clostridia bacterium]|nr:hypothetical protein [Clostridia bacterium]